MNRLRKILFAAALLSSSFILAYAGETENQDPLTDFFNRLAGKKEHATLSVAYDIDFDMNFDNRELYRSRFSRSMTIFGARLTPSIGFQVNTSEDATHRVMVGVDVMKNFGSTAGLPDHDVLEEITLYYKLEKNYRRTDMEIYAGIFPRKAIEGSYSEAFFSDSLKFYDNNLEGILLKFRRPRAYFEVGCDWMGQQGQSQRERFMIFSSGEGKIAPLLSLGYAAYMYHYAGSYEVRGVVDNVLINPYARLDLGRRSGLQTLSFRLGWLQGLQNDRRNIGIYTFPYGGEFDFEIRNWNVGIRNMMFYGMDMMPYYNYSDAGGFKYGSQLYFGDPFYRVHDNGAKGMGTYDRFEVCWYPYVSGFLDIKVGAVFHFNDFHYSGCQQVVRLGFNLNQLTGKRRL